MKRRHVHLNVPCLRWRIVAALVLWSICAQRCSALQIVLPDIGTDINYDFLSQTPVFKIANGAPTQEIIQSEVTFIDNKHLRVVAETDLHFIHIDLILRAPQIVHLFEDIFISFDESLSLLREDGSIAATSKNFSATSVDGCESFSCDAYYLGWDFHPISDLSIYGFRWSITPDLIQDAQLPATLTVDTYMWGAGSILVVPEPSSAAIVTVSIIGLTTIPRRRSRGTGCAFCVETPQIGIFHSGTILLLSQDTGPATQSTRIMTMNRIVTLVALILCVSTPTFADEFMQFYLVQSGGIEQQNPSATFSTLNYQVCTKSFNLAWRSNS